MSRTPAVSTQLRAAQARIAELEKLLEAERSQARWARESRDEANRDLESVQAILDVMPGTLARKKDEYNTYPAAIRLASYLASK